MTAHAVRATLHAAGTTGCLAGSGCGGAAPGPGVMLEGQVRLSPETVLRFSMLFCLWGKKGGRPHRERGPRDLRHIRGFSPGLPVSTTPLAPPWVGREWDEASPRPGEGACLGHTPPSRGPLAGAAPPAAAGAVPPPPVPSCRPGDGIRSLRFPFCASFPVWDLVCVSSTFLPGGPGVNHHPHLTDEETGSWGGPSALEQDRSQARPPAPEPRNRGAARPVGLCTRACAHACVPACACTRVCTGRGLPAWRCLRYC